MRKFILKILLILFLLFPSMAYARSMGFLIEEVDGDPADYVYKLKVSNGALAIAANVGTLTLQATHAALTSIIGLTEADVSILETTADDTYAVVTSGGNDYILGSNAANTALEFKSPDGVLGDLSLDANLKDLTASEIGQLENIGTTTISAAQWGYLGGCTGIQNLDADLTNIAGADTWTLYYKNGSAVLTDLACGAANTFLRFNGAAAAPTAVAVTDAVITTTDVTTNNATTSKHGFRAKLTNVAYSYLDETGAVRAATTVPADPNKDQGVHWDDSAGAFAYHEEGRYVAWTITDSDTATAVADGKQAFVVPADMNGMLLVDVTASVFNLNSAGSGTTTVVIRRIRGAAAQDMTSTGVTISHDAYTASDETVDATAANRTINTGDNVYVDVNAITTAAHKGLSVTATFRLP